MQSNIIKMILAFKGKNVSDLAAKLDKSPNNLLQILKRDNLREKELEQIAEALDCDLRIEFIDRQTGKIY